MFMSEDYTKTGKLSNLFDRLAKLWLENRRCKFLIVLSNKVMVPINVAQLHIDGNNVTD